MGKAPDIQQQINDALNLWFGNIELMLRKIIRKKDIFDPLKAKMEVIHKVNEGNKTSIRSYMINGEEVLQAWIECEPLKITFRIEPAEKYKDHEEIEDENRI